ncbi:MAG: hypothetical protein HY784_05310, partial [Chloroflexi bacterium]|nr:hypothetical protein [Chloroflexota bacterium]
GRAVGRAVGRAGAGRDGQGRAGTGRGGQGRAGAAGAAAETDTLTPTASPTSTSTPTATATRTPDPCSPISGWLGEYWNNETLSGPPDLCRNDPVLNFDWGSGSPDPLIQPESFSARWQKYETFSSGQYRFTIFHDDGARLYIDDVLVWENWCNACHVTESVTLSMTAGVHKVKLTMKERSGVAGASLTWKLQGAR